MKTRFLGIYSFPKSGNTWMRQIVSSIYFDSITEIPDFHQGSILNGSSVILGDSDVSFYKSHGVEPLAKYQNTTIDHYGYIYITRHPLDVFLSYLNFLREEVGGAVTASHAHVKVKSVEELVRTGEVEMFLDAFILFGTVQPKFSSAGSWFENVSRWKTFSEQTKKKMAFIKYEEMLAEDPKAYRNLGDVLGVDADIIAQNVGKANKNTAKDGKFFWKKKAGNYLDVLPPELIAKFEKYHGERTRSLGYDL